MRALPTNDHRLGVFTQAEAETAGWSRQALAYAARSGRVDRVAPGVFAHPLVEAASSDAIRLARCAVAAALVRPEVYVSHLAAATLRDLPTWATAPRPCVLARQRNLVRLTGLHVHRAAHRDGHFVLRHGVPTTSVARVVADLAMEFGVETALVTGDAALRLGRLKPAVLERIAADLRGTRGSTSLLDVLAHLDPRAESPLESRSRWRIQLAGLPAPRKQVEIFDLDGRFLGRVDFFWDIGVVGEVDGNVKYDDPRALRREKWRQELLETTGLRFVRWGPREVDNFAATAARLDRSLTAMTAYTGPRDWQVAPA